MTRKPKYLGVIGTLETAVPSWFPRPKGSFLVPCSRCGGLVIYSRSSKPLLEQGHPAICDGCARAIDPNPTMMLSPEQRQELLEAGYDAPEGEFTIEERTLHD